VSHCTVMIVTPRSPTLEDLGQIMAPFRYDADPLSSKLNEDDPDTIAWDYFTIRRWGDCGDLLDMRTHERPFGVIVVDSWNIVGPGEGVWHRTPDGNAKPLFPDRNYSWVMLDVHE
jgi:hypothetical protein